MLFLYTTVFLYGDSFESFPDATIVPDEEVVKKWATDVQLEPRGKTETFSMANLCNNAQLISEIMNNARTLTASSSLKSFETIHASYLESEPFSHCNNKMRRSSRWLALGLNNLIIVVYLSFRISLLPTEIKQSFP